ncbi:hypothetical protein L2E82_22974 [Cichorium intybus]|uniref:Uncharacterized protein n=1 Tax=Cichorium intybus TaxID=13427 RepID=A0ACB9DYV0_CICIN|nr:hypothetical protein L2E82_22974 [Cichorium intybus]
MVVATSRLEGHDLRDLRSMVLATRGAWSSRRDQRVRRAASPGQKLNCFLQYQISRESDKDKNGAVSQSILMVRQYQISRESITDKNGAVIVISAGKATD